MTSNNHAIHSIHKFINNNISELIIQPETKKNMMNIILIMTEEIDSE